MYKLLVVDDEPRQVRAMANIISQIRPDYEVFTAGDGQEALEFIINNPVDILFTDIRMPVMDGLQLVEELSRRDYHIKTVIISGYGEFEYAQKALRFGVADYIVKPLGRMDIDNMLAKLEQSIESEQEELKRKESLIKKLDSSFPVYFERLLNKWLNGNMSQNDLIEMESVFPFKGAGTVIITYISKLQYFTGKPEADAMTNILQYLKYSMKEILNTVGHSVSFFLEGEKEVMVTVLNTEKDFNLTARESLKRLNEFINSIKSEYGFDVAIGLGTKTDDIFNDIRNCFQQAREAVSYRFYTGLSKVIDYSSILPYTKTRPINIQAFEKELDDAVNHSDTGRIFGTVSNIFASVTGQRYVDPKQFKDDLTHIVLNQAKKACNLMLEDDYGSFVEEIKNNLIQCEDYKEFRQSLNNTLSHIAEILNNKDSNKNLIIIQKCKNYIEEHYMKDISLEDAAQKFHFNPSYFSNLFKTYSSLGFSEFLTKVRIRKAQQLLRDSEDNVSDIARMVGYKDATYFSRIFKREVGISPDKYRRINSK